jgi:hypothetical protein
MKRSWLAVPAMAFALGMGSVPAASAEEPFKWEDFFRSADANKDSMVTRQEFMEAAGKRYDAMMDKMKKMGDKGAPLMKGNAMTKDGVKMLFDEWRLYGGSA